MCILSRSLVTRKAALEPQVELLFISRQTCLSQTLLVPILSLTVLSGSSWPICAPRVLISFVISILPYSHVQALQVLPFHHFLFLGLQSSQPPLLCFCWPLLPWLTALDLSLLGTSPCLALPIFGLQHWFCSPRALVPLVPSLPFSGTGPSGPMSSNLKHQAP